MWMWSRAADPKGTMSCRTQGRISARPSVRPSVHPFFRPSIHLQLVSFACCIYNGINHVWLGRSGDAKTDCKMPEKQMWNKLIDQPSNQRTYWQTDGRTETGTLTGISHRGWAGAVMWRAGAVVGAIITMASVMCDGAGVEKTDHKGYRMVSGTLALLMFFGSICPFSQQSIWTSIHHPSIHPSIHQA